MTKEEYLEKLTAQFGDETLIPETNSSTTESTGTEESTEAVEPSQESQESEATVVTEEKPATEAPAEEPASTEQDDDDGEPVNPENGKKFSNKKIKKTIWENKHLAKEVADLKRQLAELMEAQKPKEEPEAAPTRSQFASEEDFVNAAFAHNLKLLSKKNKEEAEQQMAAARFMEEKQRLYNEKIKECIPSDRLQEFNTSMEENFEGLRDALSPEAQNDIVSMSSTPLILWKLAQNPELVSVVNKMNPVERVMFCDRMAEKARSEFSSSPAEAPKAKAPILGKVGTGKPGTTKNPEEMSADEMYALMSKRLSGS